MGNRTIVLGLDGATFTILDQLVKEGVMPFLKECMEEGVRGTLASTVPPLTPPAWTSMMTGRTPGSHGIFDFFKFESRNARYLTLNSSRDIKCETIWSIISRYGLKAASLNFVMMAPARPISGYIVPGWVPWRLMKRAIYPPDFYQTLKGIPEFNLKELATDVKVDEIAVEGCNDDEYGEWIEAHTRREDRWFDILRYVIEENSCDLVAIVLDGVDKIQHLCWRFLNPDLFPENPSAWDIKVRDLCLDYFRKVDTYISESVRLAGPNANFFIVSDHGFTATKEIFYLNTWLEKNGYLVWANDTGDIEVNGKLGLGLNRKQSYLIDWTKTTAYAVSTGSNGMCICIAGDHGEYGIDHRDYANFRKELVKRLKELTDPTTGDQVIVDVWTRDEIYVGNQLSQAPDITLRLRDDGFVSIRKSDVILEPRAKPLGTHHPDGVFIAWGSSMQKGITIPKISIVDITPILLYSLDVPIPSDLEGKVITEIFKPSCIETRPVRIGEPTQEPELFPRVPGQVAEGDTVLSPEDEEEIKTKLMALGYLE